MPMTANHPRRNMMPVATKLTSAVPLIAFELRSTLVQNRASAPERGIEHVTEPHVFNTVGK